MSSNHPRPRFATTVRALLHMRLRALGARASLIRFGAVFAGVLTLSLLAVDRGEARLFWETAIRLFVAGFLPLYCLTKGGEGVRSALREGTMEYLWTRPTRRSQLFLGFYAGSTLSIWATIACCLVALTLAAAIQGAWAGWGPLALVWLQSLVAASAFTGVSMLLAALTSKFVALGIVYFLLVEVGLGSLPSRVSSVSIAAHSRAALEPLATTGRSWAETSALGPMAAMLTIGLVVLALGVAVFSSTGYVAGGEKEA